jgi:ribosomal protein L16 Arg81 hydroxylase
MTSTFERLIAPVSFDEFMATYWQELPCVIQGSAGKVAQLPTWNTALEAASRRELKAPRVRILKDGVEVPPKDYFAPNEDSRDRNVRLSALERFLASGATLLYNDAWGVCQVLDDLRAAFVNALGWHCELDIIACNSHVNGLPLHMDANDCFAIQVMGAKRWTIYPPTRSYPLRPSKYFPWRTDVWPAPRPLPASSAQTFSITAGDVLYVPRGWWHFVEPLPGPCLSVNPTVYTPTAQDFLRWMVEESSNETESRRGLIRNGGEEQLVESLRNLITRQLSADSLHRYYETLAADHPADECGGASNARPVALTTLAAEDYLTWNDSASPPVVYNENAKMFRIHWREANHHFAGEHYPVLTHLLSRRRVQIKQLLDGMSRVKRAQTRIFLGELIKLVLLSVSLDDAAERSNRGKYTGDYEAAEHDSAQITHVG